MTENNIDEKIKKEESTEIKEETTEVANEGMTRAKFAHEMLDWAKTMVLAVVVATLLTRFVVVNAVVPTGSMENTIKPGDRIFGLRTSYLTGSPKRGDVIVFKYPVNELMKEKLKEAGLEDYAKENDVSTVNYVKRVIGLPGEKIEIKRAKVYVDGSETPLYEPYLKERWVEENDGYVFVVPEGKYFVMGDNRNDSADGRYWAGEAIELADDAGISLTERELFDVSFVDEDDILGKATFKYWPITDASILK